MMRLTIRHIAALVLGARLAAACATQSSSVAQASIAASTAPVPTATLATAPDRFFVADGVRLRYRDVGRGEPVVLIHGISRSLDDWVGISDSLATDHRLIALDLFGHGKSSRSTDRARFGRAWADDVVRLLDHLHIQRAHLVGHSLGADIAANITARNPSRVITASLIAPPIYPDSAAYMQANGPWVADLEAGAGAVRFLEWIAGMPDSVAVAVSAELLAATPAPTFAAELGSISSLMVPTSSADAVRGVPTLVVAGSSDPLHVQARWLAGWWPGARLIEIPGAGHGDVIRRPEVWTAVRALIQNR
jgi:pimeloyl-ACP methyl ester carboxylesterase